MFNKYRVIKITAILPEKKFSKFMIKLGEHELVHLEKEQHSPFTDTGEYLDLSQEENAYKIFSETETIIHELKISDRKDQRPADSDEIMALLSKKNFNSDLAKLKSIKKKRQQYEKISSDLSNQISSIEKEIEKRTVLKKEISQDLSLSELRLCTIIRGILKSPENNIAIGTDEFFIQQKGIFITALVLKGHEESLRSFLAPYSFSETIITEKPLDDEICNYNERLNNLKERSSRIGKYFNRISNNQLAEIIRLNRKYLFITRIIEAKRSFSFTPLLAVFSGWVNSEKLSELKKIFQETCGNEYYLYEHDQSEIDSIPPVILKNNKFFKPFEILVMNAGIPGNTEFDPTPLAAVSFTIMFGVMFGDIGQGLTLLITGLLLKKFGGLKSSFLFNAGHILMATGVSAFFFGFLYGSIFSNEHLIPALLFHPMNETMKLFTMTIMMGIGFITLGLIFNIISCINFKRMEEALFGTKGLPGLVLYLGLVFVFGFFIISGTTLPFIIPVLIIGFPVLIFSLRNILSWFFLDRKTIFPSGIFEYVIETIVETVEMFSAFASNTISFIRAGAFALSHAGLSMAFYTLADIINPNPYSASFIITIITGNIFIILLEGLVCTIQSMRLEYYEIFSKFFRGGGRSFSAFSFKVNNITGGS